MQLSGQQSIIWKIPSSEKSNIKLIENYIPASLKSKCERETNKKPLIASKPKDQVVNLLQLNQIIKFIHKNLDINFITNFDTTQALFFRISEKIMQIRSRKAQK